MTVGAAPAAEKTAPVPRTKPAAPATASEKPANGVRTASLDDKALPKPDGAGAGPDLASYRLGAGDRIRLVVYGEPNLTGEFGIDGTGQLGVPLIGKVNAGGMTAGGLEKRITDRLSPEYLKDPSVTVEVVTYRPFYIVGEVKKPGSYNYVNGMTVINAIALAGGYTYRAKESAFRIERGASGDLQTLSAKPGTEVLPGDVITVDERFF